VTAPLTISGWLRYPIVRRLIPADARTVLEIGAGRGAVGSVLARDFDYTGLEPDAESFAVARARLGGRVIQAADDEVVLDRTYDLVCAFEVLEHIEDDVSALERWREHIRPGGSLLISVPADRKLFGASDVRVGHYRRYDPADLVRVLSAAGFSDVEIRRYGFPLGYALLYASRLLARGQHGSVEERTASSGRWLQPSPRTAFIRRGVAGPFALMQRPFERTSLGTGLIARARRHGARSG
jgi:SAM-dependent methyltransferase